MKIKVCFLEEVLDLEDQFRIKQVMMAENSSPIRGYDVTKARMRENNGNKVPKIHWSHSKRPRMSGGKRIYMEQ